MLIVTNRVYYYYFLLFFLCLYQPITCKELTLKGISIREPEFIGSQHLFYKIYVKLYIVLTVLQQNVLK